MDKKNLDKLFQEKLKNFSEVPDEKVWQQIETSLNQKKKRRVIPFWWQLGGVAALLILSFIVFNPFTATNDTPVVVETENTDNNAIESSSKKNSNNELHNEQIDENSTTIVEHETLNSLEGSNATEDSVFEKSTEIKTIVKTDAKKNYNPLKKTDYAVATSTENKGVEKSSNVAQNENYQKNNPSEKDIAFENNSNKQLVHTEQEDEGLVKNDSKTTQVKKIGENKKSIFDEIAEQENEVTEVANTNAPKWSVGPRVAPIFFNAFGEGSPVHPIFTANSKSGNNTMSYGLSVAYEVSEKLRLRTGVHKVDFGYDTNDVEFSSSLESSARTQINNINYTARSRNVLVSSNTSSSTISGTNNVQETNDIQAITTASQNGIMSQQFGYLEVPLELEYSLINSRFGVDIIGGLSSLFLVDNMISLSSQNLTTELGEANNLNNVNFSTNIGIGINYNFSKNIRLNLDPVFKYQLNTFSQSNGTFQPFSVGVYSGFSFRF